MKSLFTVAIASVLSISSMNAFAAKPTSITFDSEQTSAAGEEYALYVVQCSNNTKEQLSAWNKRKTWCVGDIKNEDCSRKQIKAAKKACKRKK